MSAVGGEFGEAATAAVVVIGSQRTGNYGVRIQFRRVPFLAITTSLRLPLVYVPEKYKTLPMLRPTSIYTHVFYVVSRNSG